MSYHDLEDLLCCPAHLDEDDYLEAEQALAELDFNL